MLYWACSDAYCIGKHCTESQQLVKNGCIDDRYLCVLVMIIA